MKFTALACATAGTLAAPAFAESHMTEVAFGTNWLAQAEHGGFYQAVADAPTRPAG